MKKVLFLFMISICTGTSWCQSMDQPQVIGVLHDIPIVIQTTSSALKYEGKFTGYFLPGKISVGLMSRKQWADFDHMIQLGKPQKISDDVTIHIIIVANQKTIANKKVPYSQLTTNLIDTFLQQGDEWTLSLQIHRNAAIQYCFKGSNSTPSIEGYRLTQYFDSSIMHTRAKQMSLEKKSMTLFKKLPSQIMEFPPGSVPEFKINSYPLLKDSMIAYRLSDQSIAGPWKISNLFFALPNLVPNNNYRLELKFIDQQESTVYTIRIQPFWYQTLVAKKAAVLLAMALIIIAIRLYYRNRLKTSTEQRERIEEQLRTIQSQLNPHFIFNALSSIEGLITTGQTQLANEYLNNFSAIMRATLTNADKLFISLHQEIELLEQYIHIEQLRFGFDFQIQVSPELALNNIEVPPMLLQPLVENAIKHGMANAVDQKKIDISLTKKENNLVCIITNPAFPDYRSEKTAGGFGLGFMQQRLDHFKRLHPQTPIIFRLEITEGIAITQLVYTHWFR